MTPDPCDTCNQVHASPAGTPKCVAHNKRAERETGVKAPCGNYAIKGTTVCKSHGGLKKATRAAGERRLATAQAERDAARFAARRDLHPAEALLELVHYQAGIVDYWRGRVAELDATALEWGTTKVKEGGQDDGTTEEAKPHVAYVLLGQATDRLKEYATAALKAGVDERRVQLAEKQGALVAEVMRRVLGRIDLTEAQWALTQVVVPEELRALGKGDGA